MQPSCNRPSTRSWVPSVTIVVAHAWALPSIEGQVFRLDSTTTTFRGHPIDTCLRSRHETSSQGPDSAIGRSAIRIFLTTWQT